MGKKKHEPDAARELRKAVKKLRKGKLPKGIVGVGPRPYLVEIERTWLHPRLIESAITVHHWGHRESLWRISSMVAAVSLTTALSEDEVLEMVGSMLEASREEITKAGQSLVSVKTELLRVLDQLQAALAEAEAELR